MKKNYTTCISEVRILLGTSSKRALAFLLAAAVLIGACGCGAETPPYDSETSAVTTGADTIAETVDPREAIADELPETNYNGADFVLFGREREKNEYIMESETGDYVDDAIYKRNIAVEERFGVKISMETMDGTWSNYTKYMNRLTAIGMAGDDIYSLVEGDTFIVDLMGHNYFRNWLDYDFVDFDKPWWSQASVKTQTIGGKLEFVTGDYSLLLWKGLVVMYFNKKLAADNNVDDLYQLVRDNKWTLEKVQEISQLLKSDLNGDSKYDENDLYGLITTTGNCVDNFIVSSDVQMVTNDSEGFPVFSYNSDRAVQMTERVFNLMQAPGVYAIDENKNDTVLEPMFMNDHGLLFTGFLQSASAFRSMDTDFGILPYPLFDENQEQYKTFSKAGFAAFAIPTSAADPEMSAAVTTALMAESYKKVVPAYYDLTLKTKSARDNESAEMLDIIRDGFDYDLACVLLSNTDNILLMLRDMVYNGNYTFASQITKREKSVTKKLEKLKANIISAQSGN